MHTTYHFIYKTTCLVTGKWYIGMHSTKNLADGYIGSGKMLGVSVKQYGIEQHKREILEFVEDRKTLRLRESEIVTQSVISDPLCLNLAVGGEGGSEVGKLGGKIGAAKFVELMKNPEYAENHRKLMSSVQKKRQSILSKDERLALTKAMRDSVLRPECLQSRRDKYKQIEHQKGDKNSQYGKIWISNIDLQVSKCVRSDEIFEHPWIKGRNVWKQQSKKLKERVVDLSELKKFVDAYEELGTLGAAGKKFGVSHVTVINKIKQYNALMQVS